MGTKVDTPKAPTYGSIMGDALKTQIKLMPKVLSAEQRFQPAFTQLNISQLGQAARGMTDIYGQQSQPIIDLQRQLSDQNIAMQQAQMPGFVQGFREAAGSQALLQGLQRQAEQGLALGSQISPEEQRIAQQQARAAYASRGMGTSNRAIGSEILNQYNLGQMREQQRLSQAQNIAAQMESSGVPQYYQSVYAPTTLQTLGGVLGQSSGLMAGRQFQPESQMAADIAAQNQMARTQAAAASAANRTALIGSAMQLGGAAAGAAMGKA